MLRVGMQQLKQAGMGSLKYMKENPVFIRVPKHNYWFQKAFF
jgi:hypothetical protein